MGKNKRQGKTRTDEEVVVFRDEDDWSGALNGIGDIELQISEMRLVNLDIIKDFGEKIGGSAKDRYTRSPGKTEEKNKKNRLPTEEEILNTKGGLQKYFQPSVSDFEKIGFNKICSRLLFFKYYMGSNAYEEYNFEGIDNATFLYLSRDFEKAKEYQSAIAERFIECKSELKGENIDIERDSLPFFWFTPEVCLMTMLSMNLEKELGEDFNYDIARKIPFYGDKKEHINRWRCLKYGYVSAASKQKLFNLEYEYVRDGKKPLAMMWSNDSDVIIGENQKISFNPRNGSWRWYNSDVIKIYDETGKKLFCNDSDTFRENYADWLILGRKQYDKLHENDKEEWEYTDKAGLVARERKGEDWRKGRNAEPQDFLDAFGFRAVEFGETMPQKERWTHMNWAYDSFMDLAKLLDVSPKCMSLGSRLVLCFGSRGHGGKLAPMAHFEPKKFVINLTRKMGAGCLAHEWFHAFDNSLMCAKGVWTDKMATEVKSGYSRGNINDQLLNVIENNTSFVKNRAFYHFAFYNSALNLDAKRTKAYWSTTIEMYARAFEYYVDRKLKAENSLNEYLVQLPSLDEAHIDSYPYPHPEDRQGVLEHFDRFWAAVSDIELEDGTHTIR